MLIVEDDPVLRGSLGKYLQFKGFNVNTASNGVEGINCLARNGGFDIIVVDLMMPQMNGMMFLERVKDMAPEVPVLMITGYTDIKVAIEAMKKGADDFVTKPLQYEQLMQNMVALIKKSRSERNVRLDDLRKLNRKLEDKIRELSILYTISETMNGNEGEFVVFDVLTNLAAKIVNADKVLFLLHDRRSNELLLRNSYGFEHLPCINQAITLEADFYSRLFEQGETVCIDHGEEPYPCNLRTSSCPVEDRCFMLSPLVIRGERFGLLVLSRPSELSMFNPSEKNFIELMLKKASLNIENNALYESLYSNLVSTLRSLVHTIEAKDVYTQQHSDRVTQIAVKVAQSLVCSEEEIETVRFAGVLHDIGKIGISDSILQKKGSLTDEEYTIIKTHPVVGERILEPLGMMPLEKAIIRHHHERWDGRGYPDGLKEERIPFLARIVALADAYDAMTSNRVYRRALSHEKAVQEIERNSGSQFDPGVVSAFFKLCDAGSIM